MNQIALFLLILTLVDCRFRTPAGTAHINSDGQRTTQHTPGRLQGIWQVKGTHPERGSYQGLVEIRKQKSGYQITRQVLFNQDHHQNLHVAATWQGNGQFLGNEKGFGSLEVTTYLQQVDFIKQVGQEQRTPQERFRLVSTYQFSKDGKSLHADHFLPGKLTLSEQLFRRREAGKEPLFKIERWQANAHEKMSKRLKPALLGLMKTYQKDAFIAQYRERPDFIEGVHQVIYDRTNFDYYVAYPDRLNMVNKVIDTISLTEEYIRYTAFTHSLHDKAKWFDQETSDRFISPSGMVANVSTHENTYTCTPDNDAALWTGTYVASQAFRYRLTKDPQALKNIKKSVRALLTLVDITDDPKEFARTLLRGDKLPSERWRFGKGKYKGTLWKIGGNNDMLKGLAYGYLMGLISLDNTHQRIKEDIFAMASRVANHSEVAQRGKNQHLMTGVAALAAKQLWAHTQNEKWREAYLLYLEQYKEATRNLSMLYTRNFALPQFYSGIADWSGLSLGSVGWYAMIVLAEELQFDHLDQYRKTFTQTWRSIRSLRRHFYTIAAWGTANSEDRNTYGDYIKDAIWGLREFPYPKPMVSVDHRINPEWSASPLPSLPWKYIGTDREPAEGYQGLYMYPGFEHLYICCNYCWKDNPHAIGGGCENSQQLLPAVDYLHAYWMARFVNLIKQDSYHEGSKYVRLTIENPPMARRLNLKDLLLKRYPQLSLSTLTLERVGIIADAVAEGGFYLQMGDIKVTPSERAGSGDPIYYLENSMVTQAGAWVLKAEKNIPIRKLIVVLNKITFVPLPFPGKLPAEYPPAQWVWKKMKTLKPPIDMVETTTVEVNKHVRNIRLQSVRGETKIHLAHFVKGHHSPVRSNCLEGHLKRKEEKICTNSFSDLVSQVVIQAKSHKIFSRGQLDVYVEVLE